MLTSAQIEAGRDRLESNALAPRDVDLTVSIFRMFFGDLEEKYSYQFESKLEELSDAANTKEPCAQIAACLTELEDLGFGAFKKEGGRSGTKYDHLKEIWQYTSFIFSKIYILPYELSSYDIFRARVLGGSRTSSSSCTTRAWC